MYDKKVKDILLDFYGLIAIADKIVIGGNDDEELKRKYKEDRIKLTKKISSLPKKD